MDGDTSMEQPPGPQQQNPNGQFLDPSQPVLNGQPPFGQQPLRRSPLINRAAPPPPIMDPYLQWFTQQQQGYVAEMLRQQQEVIKQQQAAFMQQQEQLLRNVMSSINVQVPLNPESILDSIGNNIKEFRYEAGSNVTFAAWYKRYEELFDKDADRLDDPAKVRLLIRKLGLSEHERYRSFILPNTPKDFTLADTVLKLTSLFGSPESVISRRYRCLQIVKQPQEDYVTYACRINKSCVEFELRKLTEEQFKCLVFVCGLKSEKDAEIRTRLLCKIEERSDITLEQISEECKRLLNIRHDAAMIEEQVAAVKALEVKQRPARNQFKAGQNHERAKPGSSKSGPNTACWLCGAMHYARDCSFKMHKCSDCGRTGHKEGYCRSAEKFRSGRKKNNIVSTKVVTVNACSVEDRRKFVPVVMNRTSVRLQLDTGSDITIISTGTWRTIGSPPMSTTAIKAKTATGKPLEIDGEFWCEMVVGERKASGLVRVTRQPLNLLGADTIDSFGLWSVPLDSVCHLIEAKTTTKADSESLKAEFPKLFSGSLGVCVKSKVKLELKPGKHPVFRPKRPVAYAMYQAVDDELDRLERDKIISPVDFSEWAAPIVVVRKASGAIRICGDYSTGLNDALQPHQYPLPLPQDIFASLANCTVFSQIDLTDAFLQVEMDESSRDMLTVNTHRGLYRYNRLPPGVKAAPGAFQQLIDSMLTGLTRTCGYLDDVVVGGVDEQDHRKNLRAVLQRIQEFGFTIRAEKCSFGQPQIRYLGHLLDRQGLRPDPSKIEAIANLAVPTDVSGVRSFLGAINYYGKFVANMRNLRYPLDELLKDGAKFRWTPECQKAFERFKQILSSDLLLTHYDPKQEIIVSADASSVGLGATISHKYADGSVKVVQHAARALSKAEQGYSQPDREGLAIIFAVTKFHKMIFGRSFRLQTDHAPLLRIFGSRKGIPVYTANRLQRYALTLLLYDFTIEHVPTDKFGHADVLSRLISNHAKPDEDYVIASINLDDDIRSVVNDVATALPLSFRIVERDTQSDPVLKKVYRYLRSGWPQKSTIVDTEILRYFSRQESLSTVDGCILFGERLVIPERHRQRCLRQLHQGLPGISRMKAIARSYVYWPSVDDDVEALVKACKHCASAARSPPHSAPVPWPKPTGPWKRVHVDFAGPMEGAYFLLIVDAYTKWPEVIKTNRITSAATIGMLRGVFARLGMPELLVSDNGTQFTSAEFLEFCTANGIQHLTTAPFHPQSNGQAERFVDTFKRAVKKIQAGRSSIEEALDVFLMTYRTTPNRQVEGGVSPSEALFGRRIRTNLELLRPPPPPPSEPSEQQGSPKRKFSPHDLVYAKLYSGNKWYWAPGVVCDRIGRVMYTVWVDGRRLIRSHTNQLLSRADWNPATDGPDKPALPLDILLESWNLAKSQPESTPNPSALLDTSLQQPGSPEQPATDGVTGHTSSVPESSSSSSSTSPQSTSTDSGSAPSVPVPRRSSRNRRQPQWFDPYHFY